MNTERISEGVARGQLTILFAFRFTSMIYCPRDFCERIIPSSRKWCIPSRACDVPRTRVFDVLIMRVECYFGIGSLGLLPNCFRGVNDRTISATVWSIRYVNVRFYYGSIFNCAPNVTFYLSLLFVIFVGLTFLDFLLQPAFRRSSFLRTIGYLINAASYELSFWLACASLLFPRRINGLGF